MANSYAALCDEFYINMRLGTQMKMATDRATIRCSSRSTCRRWATRDAAGCSSPGPCCLPAKATR